MQALLEHMYTAMLLCDEKGYVRWVNASCENLLQLSASKLLGESLNDVFGEQNRLMPMVFAALDGQNVYSEHEMPIQTTSLTAINVGVTATPIIDKRQVLFEFQPRDRVKQINREEGIIAKQETTRILVRGVAHEVKNPLGGIRGAAQLLALELDDPELKDYTNVIIEEADRLRNLVDRMLGARKINQTEQINIHEVTERVLALIDAEEKGSIKLIRKYDPSIPEISADKEQLIQAVLNVVRNAKQAITETKTQDRQITVTTSVSRQYTIAKNKHRLVCRIDIIDNGPGIAKDMIENIFYPMISGRAKGTGLGLAISQQIANQHQGLIECESEPGCTCFSIFLPIIKANS